MPAAKVQYKCGDCHEGIAKAQSSVQCKACAIWFHVSCAGLNEKALSSLKGCKSLSFTCKSCTDSAPDLKLLRHEISELNSKLDTFIGKADTEQAAIHKTIADTVNSFKAEIASCLKEMKSEILDCNKLIHHMDLSTNKKITELEVENNVLHKRINRADIVVSGLPDGLDDLIAPIVKIGSIFDVEISPLNINHACYFNNRKAVLYKFNNVFLRDRIMKAYFKTKSIKICDVIGGEIDMRLYLNDHFSPASGKLRYICSRLLHKKVIMKYRILNTDIVKAKIVLVNGKEVVYTLSECTSLLNE